MDRNGFTPEKLIKEKREKYTKELAKVSFLELINLVSNRF